MKNLSTLFSLYGYTITFLVKSVTRLECHVVNAMTFSTDISINVSYIDIDDKMIYINIFRSR